MKILLVYVMPQLLLLRKLNWNTTNQLNLLVKIGKHDEDSWNLTETLLKASLKKQQCLIFKIQFPCQLSHNAKHLKRQNFALLVFFS